MGQMNSRIYQYGKPYGYADGQRRDFMAAAQRQSKQQPGAVPGAPNLSSRISPGTVPMKKGMR